VGECAVKRLEEGSMQGQREFLQEVQVLIQKSFCFFLGREMECYLEQGTQTLVVRGRST